MGKLRTDFSAALEPDMPAFHDFWGRCLHGSSITCSATGTEYPGVTKPLLFFLDSIQYELLAHVRVTDTSPSTSVLTWVMAFMGAMATTTFPDRYGGSAEIILPEYTEEEIVNGRSMKLDGKIRHVRGLPDMYDWEAYPQDFSHIPMFKDQDKIPYTFHKFTRYVM
jgi:hypothetical protein